MEAEIGEAAGRIWQHLDKHGATALMSLSQRVKVRPQMAAMAIGWLAREGKLNFVREGRIMKVDLRGRRAARVPCCSVLSVRLGVLLVASFMIRGLTLAP